MEQYDRLLKKFVLNNPNYGKFVEDLQILVSPNEIIFQRFVRDFEVFLRQFLIISTSTENNEAKNAVHQIHETIKQVVIKNPKIRNENWWNDIVSTYLTPTFQDAVLKQMRENDSTWIKSWSLMANLTLHTNNELRGASVNVFLKIVEVAFRLSKTNPVLADQAFICWMELMEIISSNNNRAQIKRLGGLFIKPLATNVPPKTFALKLKAWETLIEKIAILHNEHVEDIVVSFLKTAFNKNINCLAHHVPNGCLTLIQKLLNAFNIELYSIHLVSSLSRCAEFEVNPVQYSSLFAGIIGYCQTLTGDKYINHLKELLHQTILTSKTLKQFPNFEIITTIGFMMDNQNFLATMNDFKTRSEIIMPFMNLIIENKDIHTANSRTKENILGTWHVLYSSFVTHLSINEITQDEKDMLLTLIVFPLSSNLWSSATSKRWISFCEILKQKDMFTELGEMLINYMMERLKQSKMTTIVVLEILKIISNIETTLWQNFVPILELVCDKLPPRDFNQIMSVIHLTELAIGVDPKTTYTLINLKLTSAANNVDQLQQHKIKTSLLKLRKKFIGTDELKLNTSPESKTNGSISMKSNFLYRMAKAEEKKKDSVSSISNLFNTKEKPEEKTEKENFDQENKKKEEKDISISNKLLDSIEKPVDYVEKENMPKSPLLVKSNQIHIVCNDAKSPKSPGLNKSRKSPGSKVITPKRTTPSKCTYFENDNASDYVVVTPKQTTTVLTEHQKEVMSKRRSDIPALYQDLSQDTQTFIEDKSNDKQTLIKDQSPKSHTLITPDRTEFIKPNKKCSAKKLDFSDQPRRSSVRNLAKSKEEIENPEEKNVNKRKSDPGNRLVLNASPKKPNGETDPVPRKRGRKVKDPQEGMPIKKLNLDTSTESDDNLSTGNILPIKTNSATDLVTKRRPRKRNIVEDKKLNGDINSSLESICSNVSVATISSNAESDSSVGIKTNSTTDFVTKKRGRKSHIVEDKKINGDINSSLESICNNGSVATVIPETTPERTGPERTGHKRKQTLRNREETPVKINTEDVESISTPFYSDITVIPITPSENPVPKKRGRKPKQSGDKEGTVTEKNTEIQDESISTPGYSDITVIPITPSENPVPKKRGRKPKQSGDNKKGTPTKINTTEETQAPDSSFFPGLTDVLPITPNFENPVQQKGRKESLDNKEGTVTKINTETEKTQAVESISFSINTLPIAPSPVKKSGRDSLRSNKEGTPVTKINTETIEKITIEVQETPKSSLNKTDELETSNNDGFKEETSKIHEIKETTLEKLCKKCKESFKKDTLFEKLVDIKVKLCKKCKEIIRKERILTEVLKETPKCSTETFSKTDDLIVFTPRAEITPKQYFNKYYIKKSLNLTPKSQIEDKMEIDNSDNVIKNLNFEQTSVAVKDVPKFEELVVNEIEIKPNEIQNKSLETENIEITEEMKECSSLKPESETEELQIKNEMEVEHPETPENIHKRKRSDLESPISDTKRPKLEIEQTPVPMYKRIQRQKQRKRIQSKSKCTINFIPNNIEQYLYKLNKDVVKKDLFEEPKEEIKNSETSNEQTIEVDENQKTPIKNQEPDKTLAYSRSVGLLSSFVENDEMTKLHLASTKEMPKILSPLVFTSPVTSRAGRIMLLNKETALLTPTKRRNIIPQQFGENWPKGPTEEWIACTPDNDKTPSRSSLKVTQAKDVKNSEETQPKRVSFLDPPVTQGLIFNNDNTGALHLTDTPQDSLKRVWAKENETNATEKIDKNEEVIEVSDDETSKTDEYDLKSLPNINNCDKPVNELLSGIKNFSSTLESELIKLGVQKINEIAFLTQENIEQLTIVPPKQQTLYLAVKEFLENDANNKSNKEIQETQIEDKSKEEEDENDIGSYQGVIKREQLLRLAKNNKSFLECLHDLMTTEFLSQVFLSKISK